MGCKCDNNNPSATQGAGARELKASRNEEDRAKPHCVYRSGAMVVQAVEAPSQLATDAVRKRDALSSRKPSLLSCLKSPHNCNPYKTHSKKEDDTARNIYVRSIHNKNNTKKLLHPDPERVGKAQPPTPKEEVELQGLQKSGPLGSPPPPAKSGKR